MIFASQSKKEGRAEEGFLAFVLPLWFGALEEMLHGMVLDWVQCSAVVACLDIQQSTSNQNKSKSK